MLDFYKKYWKTAFDIGLIILTIYLFMVFFHFLFNIATPIFISFILYLIIKPFANFLQKKGIKKVISVTISTLFFVSILLSFFIILGTVIASQIQHLSSIIPTYTQSFQIEIDNDINYIQKQYKSLPFETAQNIKLDFEKLSEKASTFSSNFLVDCFSLITSIPKLIVNFVIGLILAFFLSIEIDGWNEFATKNTPKTFKLVFHFLKDTVIKGISGYIKAQLILTSFTFILCFIGFLIFGISNGFTIAIVAGLVDLLPLLGVSAMFIPWIIYLFVIENTAFAIKLIILLAVIIGFRQVMEPKITGNTLGVSSFTMLSTMIISMSLFGVLGIVLSPIILIFFKSLIQQGHLKNWVRIPTGELTLENDSTNR